MPIWSFSENDNLWLSIFANAITGSQAQQTFGGRILEQWLLLPELTWGGYLEQYVSSHTGDYFLNPERLQPWLGTYALWQVNRDLGLGLELALSPLTQTMTRADLMLTWKLSPIYLNILLRSIPTASLNLGIQFNFD